MDEGGYGVPAKIGRVNMNGEHPIVLKDNITRPEAITIDLEEKLLYFSTEYPSKVSIVKIDYMYRYKYHSFKNVISKIL